MSLISETEFAVLDVETTGFAAKRADRVVEIAVLRLAADGSPRDEYVTLVNPGRDLGPTGIHGLSGRDVLDAPRFSDIAGDVLSRLDGAVVVGHNVRFDASFLVSECDRAGHVLPEFPTLCTLLLTSTFQLPVHSRQLPHVCQHFGIAVESGHSAESDARATSCLLRAYLRLAEQRGFSRLTELGCLATPRVAWPRPAPSNRSLRRSDAQALRAAEPHYLARLVTRLMGPIDQNGSVAAAGDVTSYLALLDKVLEDRLVSADEADALMSLARDWGLSGEQVCAAHRSYVSELARAALADNVVTESERRDLLEVTRLLGFDSRTLDSLLAAPRCRSESPRDANDSSRCPDNNLAGKSVCFTGALTCQINGEEISREMAQQLALKAGLRVADNVTKSLDILVVADPHSLSGKAQKARKYGTRIMAEPVFWQALGVKVD